MRFPVLRPRAALLALAIPCGLTTAARAQGQGDKDLKVVSAYTLTMPKYRQLMQAMVNLGKAAQRDTTLSGALESSGDQSLDQMVAQYSSIAPVKRAIADAGLTPREYAVAQLAMLQAGMAYGMMKAYKLTPDSVSRATGVSRANLEFYRINEAELNRMGKELEAQMPKEPPSDEADAAAEEPDSAE